MSTKGCVLEGRAVKGHGKACAFKRCVLQRVVSTKGRFLVCYRMIFLDFH